MQPGDLVRVRFWEDQPPSPLIGIVIAARQAPFSYENTNFYKVWICDPTLSKCALLAEFASEELELIQELPCQIKRSK